MFMYVGGAELLADKTLSHHVFFFHSCEKTESVSFKKNFSFK